MLAFSTNSLTLALYSLHFLCLFFCDFCFPFPGGWHTELIMGSPYIMICNLYKLCGQHIICYFNIFYFAGCNYSMLLTFFSTWIVRGALRQKPFQDGGALLFLVSSFLISFVCCDKTRNKFSRMLGVKILKMFFPLYLLSIAQSSLQSSVSSLYISEKSEPERSENNRYMKLNLIMTFFCCKSKG